MRLTVDQQRRIQQIARDHLGPDAVVSLFGSRVEDDKRGGDVDLFIEVPRRVSLMERAALNVALERSLSLPVDVVISEAGKPLGTFQALAKANARPLGHCTQ